MLQRPADSALTVSPVQRTAEPVLTGSSLSAERWLQPQFTVFLTSCHTSCDTDGSKSLVYMVVSYDAESY